MIEFTVYGTPAAAGSKRAVPIGGKHGGRTVVIDASRKAAPWKKEVSQVAGKVMAGRELLRGPIEVWFTFYVRRPKGHYGVKGVRKSAPVFPMIRPDLLKLARGVEDSLTGIVYYDDALIVDEHLSKRYGEPERCEVRICEAAAVSARAVAPETSEQQELIA